MSFSHLKKVSIIKFWEKFKKQEFLLHCNMSCTRAKVLPSLLSMEFCQLTGNYLRPSTTNGPDFLVAQFWHMPHVQLKQENPNVFPRNYDFSRLANCKIDFNLLIGWTSDSWEVKNDVQKCILCAAQDVWRHFGA